MELITSNGGGYGRGATAFNCCQHSKDTESFCVEKKAIFNGRHGGRNRDIFTSCTIPSHMVMVSQIHLYRLQPLVFLQSCYSDLRDGLEVGGVSSMRAYGQPPYVPMAIKSAPRGGLLPWEARAQGTEDEMVAF